MNMHNHRNALTTLAACTALFLATPTMASTAKPGSKEVHINAEHLATLSATEQQRVLDLRDRLEAVLATDKTTLSAADRTELRAEWKSLKKEMREVNRAGNAIYISTGGLIIIILLLIILL
jgi:hypothetical protein